MWTADPSADGRRSAAICESNCHLREAYRLAASGANLVSLLFLLAQRYAGAVKAHESCNCCQRLSASNCGCMSVYNQPAGSTQPCIPPGSLNQSSTGFGGNVTSAGWQVTLCDPMWHVSSRSGEACCKLSVYRFLPSYLSHVEVPLDGLTGDGFLRRLPSSWIFGLSKVVFCLILEV